MGKTKISWATYTVNPVNGCSKPAAFPSAARAIMAPGEDIAQKWLKPNTSPECARCYAETLSTRRGWSEKPWLEANEAENVKLRAHRFKDFGKIPVKDPQLPPSERERFFIASMGDIFHPIVPDSFLRELWDYMLASEHVYMLLTKRPERAAAWPGPWPANIWLGATCGHPVTKWRLEYLRRSAAAVRFVSMEPLLSSMLPIDLEGIDQVIVGGESGAGFRPMQMQWAREMRDACKESGKAFFYKQDAAFRTEQRPFLVEPDGRKLVYHQFPGELSAPVPFASDAFPIL